MAVIDVKIEKWKNKLLDLGKRNRLINYRETTRSTLSILEPDIFELFDQLVNQEKRLSFPRAMQETYLEDDETETQISLLEGDLKTSKSLTEQQKTLASLRNKSKLAKEEQGTNILYLSFGFLQWKESEHSEQVVTSPLVLVPVNLTLESLTSPFMLQLGEDEIVINPTLAYKLENDFGIKLPRFDVEEESLQVYFNKVIDIVNGNQWDVAEQVSLGLLSFLKINMYKDIENNKDKIMQSRVARALGGSVDSTMQVPSEYNGYNHDENIRAVDTFQVVDADASQQDAILYAKKNISFVLQGPPGTGKSQTITNIISECLADSKKVLFVSEKMAALEVVYRRLDATGLADFCLTLHSHKANKKAVLEELGRTLHTNRVKLQDEALYKLELLEKERDELNQYSIDLHTKCLPLNKTIYEVNGLLAKLVETPNIIFEIEGVREISFNQLSQYKYALEKVSKTIDNMSDDFTKNPWQDCHVPYVTNELRHDVETNLGSILPQVEELYDTYINVLQTIGLDNISISLRGIKDTLNVLEIAKESPIVPENWLNETDIEELAHEILYFDNLQKEYSEQRNITEQKYNKEILLINAKEKKEAFEKQIVQLMQSLNTQKYCDEDHIIENLVVIEQQVIEWANLYETLIKEGQKMAEVLGQNRENLTINQINRLSELLGLLYKEVYPTELWYGHEGIDKVKNIYTEAKEKYNSLKCLHSEIEELYEPKILEIDYEQMLLRFKTEYTSPFKIFNKMYKQDKTMLRGYRKEVIKKISDADAVDILMKISKVHELTKQIELQIEIYEKGLGRYYNGMNTKWDSIEDAINHFEKISSWGGTTGELNEHIRRIIEKGNEMLPDYDSYKIILELLENEEKVHLEEVFNCNKLELTYEVEQIKSYIAEKLLQISNSIRLCEELNSYSFNPYGYKQIIGDLERIIRLQEIESIIAEKEDTLKNKYAFLYCGMSTNWEEVRAALHWFARFKDSISKYELSYNFSKEVCSNKVLKDECDKGYELLTQANAKVEETLSWFMSLFDNIQVLEMKEMKELIKQMGRCVNNIAALEEWIDYRSSREECTSLGLGEFIKQVEIQHIDAVQVVPTFLKRFYKLWLDTVLLEYPSVKDFRRRVQEQRIKEFVELDKLQMDIAKARLKERIISTLPDVNYMTLARDEVGILKRELGKQRKIMPLRKLFKVIPNLLTTLKPCLMMSPLSVSLFLDADNYQFDTIIFDEASQICTEDAIGAIFRGKQVIIAGDNKQLPPTNFFATSTSDIEFDIDSEEEDDSEGYESILDEALTSLPERTLKWHYRSKHEHLIAFSNVKIYNNELITFPSAVDKVENNGVEYIYVKDGIYERSGKKCNTQEATKVAQMVIEHFRKFPYRSLGVVTFSEAQQHAVEMAIRNQRLNNPQYEQFFKEDREEAFFIKNLENVQGDERDTIIFSIGYGKDSNGKILMNFGPLSRTGGYRRLNVGITRAKYNVKLVGSIMPTDINLEKTNAEGVKMLRSYMEFAIQGQKALENELVIPECIEVDSPFEEAVYDFLISKGYKVTTQVGCSGYRIDLAVNHPKLGGRFVLAVECDGATYHSARTARERDRLRQSVLEQIGWKVYRIWSTDWIKDPITEGAKLIDAIEEALAQYQNPEDGYYSEVIYDEQEEQVKDYLDIQEIKIGDLDTQNPYDFQHYEQADVYTVNRHSNDTQFVADVVFFVISTEQPIHYELLCKRVACLFGNQKATVKVRNWVDHVLANNLRKEIGTKEEFYFMKKDKKVVPRIAKQDDELRSIKHISTEELGEGMVRIVNKSYGIHKDDLLVATARAFGYNRKGANITQAVEKAYKYLLKQNRLKEEQDKISMA